MDTMDPVSITPDKSAEFVDFVESLNEKLRDAGAESAERAFGMGCALGLFPAVTIIAVLFIFGVINLILAVILLGMVLLALVGIAMLLASRARINALKRTYRTSVKPEIARYLDENNLTRQQFDQFVNELLPEDAPLQTYLASS